MNLLMYWVKGNLAKLLLSWLVVWAFALLSYWIGLRQGQSKGYVHGFNAAPRTAVSVARVYHVCP